MAHHDILVIGASAGGVEALQALMRKLPRDLPASIFVVLHIPHSFDSKLASILSGAGPIPAHEAIDGEPIRRGHIYVPAPDHHLLIEQKHIVVVRGPKENRNRPAIDPLFRSAAIAYGPRTIGTILCGNLDDGTSGLWQIKRCGGLAVVLDPKDTRFPSMPKNALANVKVDYVVPLSEMGPLLARLVRTRVVASKKHRIAKSMIAAHKFSKMQDKADDIYEIGRPSVYVCPECSGTLFIAREGKLQRFRCRTGHAYTESTLLSEQVSVTEAALWSGARALREQADLLKHRANAHPRGSSRYKKLVQLSRKAEQQAIQIRNIIENNGEGVAGLESNTDEMPGRSR